jgi:hypothetical protein
VIAAEDSTNVVVEDGLSPRQRVVLTTKERTSSSSTPTGGP